MGEINNSKNSFMKNVGLILMSQMAVKILGLAYRMVITNIKGFGDMGNGYYTVGFQIYTLLLAISSVGIPNAISKIISEKVALSDYRGAHRVFKTAIILFACIGMVSSALLYFCAEPISKYIIGLGAVKYTIQSLAPSIFFVCVSSVIRGYFTGLSNMKATSTSQVLEQIFKSVLTILFVIAAVGQSPEIMSAVANLATSVSTVLSFLYLLAFYKKNKPVFKDFSEESSFSKVSAGKIAKSILMLSIPISLGSIISAVNRVIDTATITRGIAIAFSECIPAYGLKEAIFNPTMAQLESEAARLAGMLAKSDTLINMPLALNIAFSTVLVPAISRALAVGDKKEAAGKVNYSFLISIILILPCCVGYAVLAEPIYKLIYPNASLGYDLLRWSSAALIFTALNQTISGSLQGLGKVFVPATGLLLGCVAKIILNIALIRIPQINIYGAVISSIVCQIISFGYCFRVLAKSLKLKMSIKKYIIKPIITSTIMGTVAFLSYKLLFMLHAGNLISLMGSIGISVVFYGVITLKSGILSKDEILELPAGSKLIQIFSKLRLI